MTTSGRVLGGEGKMGKRWDVRRGKRVATRDCVFETPEFVLKTRHFVLETHDFDIF